jgi:hypothetical protein
MPMTRMLICCLSLLTLAACSGSDEDQQSRNELEHAEQTWANAAIHDYQYTLTLACFCGSGPTQAAPGTYSVVVSDDVVESAFDTGSGEYLSDDQAASLPTIDALFDRIEDAYDDDADHVDVSYDAVYGFPVDLAIDPIAGAIDDEIEYHVRDFM